MRKINIKISGSEREDGYHKILFIDPKPTVGPGDLAERLVNLRLFEDIFVENHKKGYVARVRFFPGREPQNPDKYLIKNIGNDFGRILKVRA